LTSECGLVPPGSPADTDARTIPAPREVGETGPVRLTKQQRHAPLAGAGPGLVIFVQVVEAIMRFGGATSFRG
jgi:hypothetical protein